MVKGSGQGGQAGRKAVHSVSGRRDLMTRGTDSGSRIAGAQWRLAWNEAGEGLPQPTGHTVDFKFAWEHLENCESLK